MHTMVKTATFLLLAASLGAGCAHERSSRTTNENEQPGSRTPAASPATSPTAPPVSSPSTTPGSGSGTMDSGPGTGGAAK
jgi:hypothetical protein